MDDSAIPENINSDQILSLMIAAFNQTPYHQHIGLVFDYTQEQGLHARFDKQSSLMGNIARNMVHGGLISGVFDALGGVLCSIELIEKYKHLDQTQGIRKLNRLCTVDLSINYHAPAKAESYIAKGEVVHQGNSIFHITMRMFDEKENLIASAIANYMY